MALTKSYYIGEGYPFSKMVDEFNELWKDKYILYTLRKSRTEAYCAFCFSIDKVETTLIDLLAQDKQEFIVEGRRIGTFIHHLTKKINEFNRERREDNQTLGVQQRRTDGAW